MKQNWIVFIGIMAVLAFLALGGTTLSAACNGSSIAQTQETWGQCARGWIGALSGWIAALAAGATIFVLLRQIRENEKTAHRKENEAYELFIVEVRKLLHELNIQWEFLEKVAALKIRDAGFQEGVKHHLAWAHRSLEKYETELDGLIPLMHPKDASRCRGFVRIIKRALQDPPESDPQEDQDGNLFLVDYDGEEQLDWILRGLKHFGRDAAKFNAEFGDIFIDRDVAKDTSAYWSFHRFSSNAALVHIRNNYLR